MEGPADVETNRAFRPCLLAQRHCSLNAGLFTAEHELAWRIVVCRNHQPGFSRGFGADLLDRSIRVAKDRGHSAGTLHAALVHQLSAASNDTRRVLEPHRSSAVIRCQFAE